MKQHISNLIKNLEQSFTNDKGGFSARKLTAFVVIVLAAIAHVKWISSCYHNNDFGMLPEILMIDYSFILSLLGLTTWQSLQEKKSSSSKPNEPTS